MSETHDNKFTPAPQQGSEYDALSITLHNLSKKELECVSDLIYLLGQPETPASDTMIVHFWLTLADRLTDKEYARFCEKWGVGGES